MSKKRDRASIRSWLVSKKITVQDIADDAGVDISLASRTMNHENSNRRVLRALLRVGCPEKLLCLPDDLLTVKAA